MGTPNGDWNRGKGTLKSASNGHPKTGLKRPEPLGASFFRKALSIGTWLLILALLISVLKGMDQQTFTRLVNGIRISRNSPPAVTQARSRPPEPLAPARPASEPPAPAEPAEPADAPPPVADAPAPVAAVATPAHPIAPPAAESTETREQKTRIAEVVLSPAPNGNFFVKGEINGQEVIFVVDTGASAVSIPEKLRWKLNLAQGNYRPSATASGVTGMYETSVKTLSIGPIKLRDVQALINPNAPDETVLLGMTALREVRLLQQDGHMVLQQEIPTEAAAVSPAPPPPPPRLKKSVKDCMGGDKVVNARVLKCMEGEADEP